MENIKSEISQILFWLDELELIKTYNNWIDGISKLFYTPPKIRVFNRILSNSKEIELSEWGKIMFQNFLDEEKEHIEKLLSEKDKELIETAKAIQNNKIRYKEPR